MIQQRIRRSFNPSTGLSVFQTTSAHRCIRTTKRFQSLDWVERLSDAGKELRLPANGDLFQSLDWVERLSDLITTMKRRRFDVSIPRLG